MSGTYLFVGTNGGVFCSTDSGRTWTAANTGLPTRIVRALAVLGGNLYAGTDGGVFLSTDSGMSWIDVNTGLPTRASIGCFAISGATLFAGTVWDNGVFLSTDRGGSWRAVNEGLPTDSSQPPRIGIVNSLASNGEYLFAGMAFGLFETGGVWRRPLSEMVTAVQPIALDLPHSFVLGQNYPNPFNPSTTIKYELPNSSMVRLSVSDMLGREVSVLVNERRDAGSYAVKFDASELASGVYFYRIEAGKFTQTRKLILVR